RRPAPTQDRRDPRDAALLRARDRRPRGAPGGRGSARRQRDRRWRGRVRRPDDGRRRGRMSLTAQPIRRGPRPEAEAATERRGAGTLRTARTLGFYLPAVIVFVGGIVAWELLVGALNLQTFVFPKPSAILAALQANWASGRFALLPSALATLQEALLGLAIGTVAGLAVALTTARWATARGILLPLAVAANAVPIIAFAPLLNNWFGLLNPLSKALMAAVLVFFPVMANVTRGLVQVDPAALELMRSYAASE